MRLDTDRITWQEIDGELVILDLVSSTYLTTNVSGTVLMRALETDRTLPELAQALVDEYGIDADRATEDAGAFVQRLSSAGLLLDQPS